MTIHRWFITITAVILLGACVIETEPEKEAGGPVVDYFWPLQEGKQFVYAATGGITRTVTIAKVTRQENQKILVETEEAREGPNLPEALRKPRRMLYEIDSVNNIIYRYLQEGSSAKAIVMAGPVQEGTKWAAEFVVSGQKGLLKATGSCSLTSLSKQQVLGTEMLCAQYSCPIESQELSVKEGEFNCQGVGRAESQFEIVYKTTKQEPTSHYERLMEVK